MKRRTEGIKEFQFRHVYRPEDEENYDTMSTSASVGRGSAANTSPTKNNGGKTTFDRSRSGSTAGAQTDSDLGRMCICICISGWLLNDESEFDTPFGIEPRNQDVAARLRLFYHRYNRENMKYSSLLAREYQGREEDLERECLIKYGASPFDSWRSWGGSEAGAQTQTQTEKPLYCDVPEEEKREVYRLIESYDESLERQSSINNSKADSGGGEGGVGGIMERSSSTGNARRARLLKKKTMSSSLSTGSPGGGGGAAGGGRSGGGGGDGSVSTSFDDDGHLDAEVRRIVGLQLSTPPPPSSSTPSPSPPRATMSRQGSDKGEEGDTRGLGGGEDGQQQQQQQHMQDERQDDASSASSPRQATRLDSETEALLELVEEGTQVIAPWWLETFPYFETFTLRWESKALFDLGSSVMEIVASLGQQAALEVLTLTAAATLISALAWPITLLQAADMIDSTWTICCEKADRAGQLLAQVLMKKEHGHRPVVLVGYSMGARVIMSCLLELAKVQKDWENEQLRNNHGRRRGSGVGETPTAATASAADLGSPAAGLVHTVVMLGAPVSSRDADWRKARGIVADRLVNCYSKKDWVLSLMYRYQKLTLNAAGIAPVKTAGVENVDVTEVVTGHQFYSSKIKECLLLVGLDDCFAASAAGMDGQFRRREADTEIATATNGVGVEEEEEEGIMGDDDDDEDEGGHGRGGGGGGRRERGDPPIILY